MTRILFSLILSLLNILVLVHNTDHNANIFSLALGQSLLRHRHPGFQSLQRVELLSIRPESFNSIDRFVSPHILCCYYCFRGISSSRNISISPIYLGSNKLEVFVFNWFYSRQEDVFSYWYSSGSNHSKWVLPCKVVFARLVQAWFRINSFIFDSCSLTLFRIQYPWIVPLMSLYLILSWKAIVFSISLMARSFVRCASKSSSSSLNRREYRSKAEPWECQWLHS